MAPKRTQKKLLVNENVTRFLIHDFGPELGELFSDIDMLERWKSNNEGLDPWDKSQLRSIVEFTFWFKRNLEARKDDSPWAFCDDSWAFCAGSWPYFWPDFYDDEYIWTELFNIFKRRISAIIDGLKMATHADTGAAQNVVSSELAGTRELKRGLSGTIDGLKVSALADTGAAQNVVSGNFARARKLDVAGSPSSFRQGNSKLAHSLGTSKN